MTLKNTLIALTLSLLSFAGCKSAPVPAHFEPLTHLKERTFGDDAFVTTFHTSVWVNNIEEFLKRHPEGSYSYNALMSHERVHSIRMGNIVSTLWFALRYSTSTEFMWEEEQLGWYFELTYRKQRGILKPAEHVAIVLSQYKNIFGKMVSYNDALVWVRDVIAGRWKPKLSSEEWELYEVPLEAR